MLVRYPHLRPDTSADVNASGKSLEPSESTAWNLIAQQDNIIAAHPEGQRVMDGLSLNQRQQLAALVIDQKKDFDYKTERSTAAKALAKAAKEADRRQRKLETKLKNIRDALDELLGLAGDLHPGMGGPYKLAAEECLNQLDMVGPPATPEMWQERLETHKEIWGPPEDPSSFALVELYRFFRHECQQNGKESEVRAAIVRNEFLAPAGKGKLAYKSKYQRDTAESKAGSAVRNAVSRYPSAPGTKA
jgi:hypothetical protein